MIEALESAVEDLKRIDHSIFVSLKYTRTVDVLINIVIRMVDCYESLFLALLKYALENKIITDIPQTPKERCLLLKNIFKEQEVHDNVDLYMLLKAMLKSNYTKENEYRRHVAMRTIVAGREEIININIISQYYEVLTSLFHMVDNTIKGTYIIGSGKMIDTTDAAVDEENPNNPYWSTVKIMKEEAEAEIARDKIIRDRIRMEKQQREQKWRKEQEPKVKKIKRITKRKPKIKPKKVISKDKQKILDTKKKKKKK